MIFFAKNKHSLPLCFSTLADKSCDPFDFCGNTGSNGTGAWSHHACVKLFPITQQCHAFSKRPCTSPINASGAKNVHNVIRFVRQCISTLYLHLVPVRETVPWQTSDIGKQALSVLAHSIWPP